MSDEKTIASAEQYQAELVKAYAVAEVLRAMPLDEMVELIARADALGLVELIARADAVGPLFHPSEWIKIRQKMKEDLEIVRALAGARAKVCEARKKAGLEP